MLMYICLWRKKSRDFPMISSSPDIILQALFKLCSFFSQEQGEILFFFFASMCCKIYVQKQLVCVSFHVK